MSINEVFMPALSSTMTEGKIVSWVKSPGDKVEKGETVVVVESDKADMDVETFYEGYLAHIIVPAGETAPVGAAIAYVVETEAEIPLAKSLANAGGAAATPTPVPVTTAPVAAPVDPSQNGSNHQPGRVVVSPRARKLAKELKVDLSTLAGSGPYGRIVAEDVEVAVGKVQPVTTPVITSAPANVVIPIPVSAPVPVPVPVVNSTAPGQLVPFTTLQNAGLGTAGCCGSVSGQLGASVCERGDSLVGC